MKFIRLKNITDRTASFIFEGPDGPVQYKLAAGESRPFDADVAQDFCRHRPDDVELVSEEQRAASRNVIPDQAELLWIANATGNTDLDEQVVKEVVQNRRKAFIKVDNPKRTARPIERQYARGQIDYPTKDGPMGMNSTPEVVRIAEFSRLQVPKHIGRWLLERNAKMKKEAVGMLINSRAPSDFEPDMYWELDDLSLYLKLCDPDATQEKSEAQLKAEFKDEHERSEAVFEAKERAMRRCYFRLINPRCTLPTKAMFKAYKESAQKRPARAPKPTPSGAKVDPSALLAGANA